MAADEPVQVLYLIRCKFLKVPNKALFFKASFSFNWLHMINNMEPFVSKSSFAVIEQGACHTVALPFTLKSIFKQKKNCGDSNIPPCKNTIFKKSSKRNQNPSRYYNSATNIKFQQKPKYHLSKILISK